MAKQSSPFFSWNTPPKFPFSPVRTTSPSPVVSTPTGSDVLMPIFDVSGFDFATPPPTSPAAFVEIYADESSSSSALNDAFAAEKTQLLESLLECPTPSPSIIVPPAPVLMRRRLDLMALDGERDLTAELIRVTNDIEVSCLQNKSLSVFKCRLKIVWSEFCIRIRWKKQVLFLNDNIKARHETKTCIVQLFFYNTVKVGSPPHFKTPVV